MEGTTLSGDPGYGARVQGTEPGYGGYNSEWGSWVWSQGTGYGARVQGTELGYGAKAQSQGPEGTELEWGSSVWDIHADQGCGIGVQSSGAHPEVFQAEDPGFEPKATDPGCEEL